MYVDLAARVHPGGFAVAFGDELALGSVARSQEPWVPVRSWSHSSDMLRYGGAHRFM